MGLVIVKFPKEPYTLFPINNFKILIHRNPSPESERSADKSRKKERTIDALFKDLISTAELYSVE